MNALNAQIKITQYGPYQPIGGDLPQTLSASEFTVIQAAVARPAPISAELARPATIERPQGRKFPNWVKQGVAVGIFAVVASLFLSIALFVFQSDVLFWPTFAALATGVLSIAVSLTGAKKYADRARAK